jgi:hypothetical protein
MKLRVPIYCLFGILTLGSVALAGVDLVKLRDSVDKQPAFGTVDFSYLRKQKKTDQNGNIKLPPPPHDKADPIEVCPDDKTKYGACFRQQFPKDDGLIWLLTRLGAQKAAERGEELAIQEQFKPAAALTAIASDFYKESEPDKARSLVRRALSFLANAYHVAATDAGLPDERLRQVVLADDSLVEKPARKGPWDSLDFLYIARETRSEALQQVEIVRPANGRSTVRPKSNTPRENPSGTEKSRDPNNIVVNSSDLRVLTVLPRLWPAQAQASEDGAKRAAVEATNDADDLLLPAR